VEFGAEATEQRDLMTDLSLPISSSFLTAICLVLESDVLVRGIYKPIAVSEAGTSSE